MKNIKTLLLTAVFISLSNLPTLSMEENKDNNYNTTIKSFKNNFNTVELYSEIKGFHYGFHTNEENLRSQAQLHGLELESVPNTTCPKIVLPIITQQSKTFHILVPFDIYLITGQNLSVGLWTNDNKKLSEQIISGPSKYKSFVECRSNTENTVKLIINSEKPFALDLLSLRTFLLPIL